MPPHAPLNPFDDPSSPGASPTNADVPPTTSSSRAVNAAVEKRARRREEAVARLVADATRPPDFLLEENAAADLLKSENDVAAATSTGGAGSLKDEEYSNHAIEVAKLEARLRSQQHSTLLLASTVASSIERGLDRELHSELVRQGKDAQGVISKICHDHSEDFLESVGRVVAALGGPCEEVKNSLEEVSSRMNEWVLFCQG